MLAVRRNVADKIIAIILLISLTISDFLFVGKSVISYALDVVKTNNTNVEFTTYFLDDNGMKVEKIERDIYNENTKLFIEVSVKNEGYFNGKISLKNNNFNIKQENLNEYVEKVENNQVTLKQINAGSTAVIELKVASIKDDIITYSKLAGETEIVLEGKYINGNSAETDTYVPVEGTNKVEIDWKSKDDVAMELNARLLTNYIYKVDNENEEDIVNKIDKRIVQIIIDSKLKDNVYPVKDTEINLSVIKDVEDIKVHTRTNSATNDNQEFSEKNYEYDEENNILKIKITNEDTNNISWKKNAQDTIVVTYVLDSNENIDNSNITIQGKIETYDEKELTATQDVLISQEIDGIITSEAKVEEESIYKGKIYTGEERDYRKLTKVNIDYANAEESISIKEKEAIYLSDKNPMTANIVYKQIQVKKEELIEIFGESGYISIRDENGTILANLTKESKQNENGYIIATLPQAIKNIEITTSKPKKVGILNIISTKGMLNSGYERSVIDTLTAIRENADVRGNTLENEIQLLNINTEANLEIQNAVISENNKELTLIATLTANDESKSLYTNPNITITLPKGITAKAAQYGILYKNGLEIESCIVNNAERSQVEIKLNGDQLVYDSFGGTKVYVKVSEIEMDPLMPSQVSNVEMTYTNEKTNTINTVSKEVKIEAKYGLIVYNEMVGYKDGEVAISKDVSTTAYGNLDINVGNKEANLRTGLVNNFGETIENVTIIGRIPTNENHSTFNAILNSVYTDNTDIQILYSTNSQAVAEDNAWGEFTPNAKAYKLVINKMEPMQELKMLTNTTIPENLGYNQTGAYNVDINYDLNGMKQTATAQIVLNTEKSTEVLEEKATEVKTKQGLEIRTLATDGINVLEEGTEVNEGQNIKYTVTIKNNTDRDYSNVRVKAIQTNGYTWGMLEKDELINYNSKDYEKIKAHYYRPTNSNEANEVLIQNLRKGESYNYTYEVSTYLLNDEKINGNETFGTIYIYSDDNLNDEIITTKNKIKPAELQVNIYNTSNEEHEWTEGIQQVTFELKNIKDEAIKDTELQITLCKDIDIAMVDFSKMNINEIFTCNSENVSLKKIEKNNNDERVITLNISNIDAEATETIYFIFETKSFEDQTLKASIDAKARTEKNNVYVSKFEKNILKVHSEISVDLMGISNGQNITENTHLNDGDIIEFVVTLSNNERNREVDMASLLQLDSTLQIQNAKLIKDNIEQDIMSEFNVCSLLKNIHLNAGESANIKVIAKVDGEYVNKLSNQIYVADEEHITSVTKTMDVLVDSKQKEQIRMYEQLNEEDDDEEQEYEEEQNGGGIENNQDGNVNQINNTIEREQNDQGEKSYKIKGTVWLDENKDARRDTGEQGISQIRVSAIDMERKKIIAITDTNEKGQYSLELKQGIYALIFNYDDDKYLLSAYKEVGVDEKENSDAITRTVEINENLETVGLTDTIDLNADIENVDLGLKIKENFDLDLQKYVTKVTVVNDEGTNTYEQDDENKLAKTEIKAKYLKDSLVIIEYKIKVANVGDIEGYAKSIEDKLPVGLTFNSSMNPTWYKDGDKLYNTSLSNTLIKPGETKELTLVLTKTMTETNTGLVHNTAKIVSSANSEGIEDKTKNDSSADVIISVSTGALINYIVIVLNIIILLGLACYIFVKYLRKINI